jgi:hypothetical protein
MDGGAASRSSAGQDSDDGTGTRLDDWTGARSATIGDLESSGRVLERILGQAQAEGAVDSNDAENIRSMVYRHLLLIASILRPITNEVLAHPARTSTQLNEVEIAIRPIIDSIVGLFGSEQNIVYFVDDDEAYINTEQIRQLCELQENLSAAIADYLDVIEDRGGAWRSKVRRAFMSAFRQLQGKVDLIVEELQAWRR